jgi:DNA-binding transcriptional MerR regulator
MLIGEVARQAGVSRDAVRLYTRLGLVPCKSRRAGSRLYADYDESTVELIEGIKIAQSIGFTLSELGPIAAAYIAGSLDDGRQRELLAAKLDQIEDKRRQLGQMSEFLRAKLDDLGPPRATPDDAPAQYSTHQRNHVPPPASGDDSTQRTRIGITTDAPHPTGAGMSPSVWTADPVSTASVPRPDEASADAARHVQISLFWGDKTVNARGEKAAHIGGVVHMG